MDKLVAFGEIMGRLNPEGFLTLKQAVPGRLNISFGGGEANVAVSYAALGGSSAFVTALPDNDLASACVATLKSYGVDTTGILRRKEGRLGLYFVETGANQRPSRVLYDRSGSTVALTASEQYEWARLLNGAQRLHITGITPAISAQAAASAFAAVQAAKAMGVCVSCDLNFRKMLWRWDASLSPRELAERTIRGILPFVDLVIANEEDAEQMLSIRAGGSDVDSGRLDIENYPAVAERIVAQFPSVRKVAITLRESLSADHNKWGAMLYDAERRSAHFAPMRNGAYAPFEIRDIVDRVGGGDAFAAGLLFALSTPELADDPTAISFAVAASCLAHSIVGDFNLSSRSDVETLMKGSGSGRVVR